MTSRSSSPAGPSPPRSTGDLLLNRDPEAPLDGVEELIVALHDIDEVLARPALARLARIGRAAGE